MTGKENLKSEIEALEQDPRARGELAAARLASMVGALMDQVDQECPDRHKDIADAMGVSPGRVSQVLSGDGNVRIATLARFLDACGFELQLTARPKSGRGLPISFPKAPRRRRPKTVAEPSLAAGRASVVEAASKTAFEFVVEQGVAVVRDRAHDVFPAEIVGGRQARSSKTKWETVS